jgi:fructose-1,6-bisphosphatase I
MTTKRTTLSRFILDAYAGREAEGAEMHAILMQLAHAGKIFAATLQRAALEGMLGYTGAENVQGEATKKLDLFGNETVVDAFASTGIVAAIVSEEEVEPHHLAEGPKARYVISIDPLDGSSNSDINGAVGTIFGIQRRKSSSGKASSEDMLRRGSEQVAAGYVLYGPSTIFVFTSGSGTNGFTLDTSIGEFILSHPRMKCPERGKYYSVNQGNAPQWDARLRSYLDFMTQTDKASGRPYSLRYVGALVADVHRSLLDGGIYFYPGDSKHETGKLRLLYECAPLAFVVEQAGGAASTGSGRILDIQATSIHQRVPIAIGSKQDVAVYERFVREGKT